MGEGKGNEAFGTAKTLHIPSSGRFIAMPCGHVPCVDSWRTDSNQEGRKTGGWRCSCEGDR